MGTVATIAALIVSGLTVLALIGAFFRWVWTQAKGQEKQTNAIVRNTEATRDLTDKFGLYVDKADGHLLDHEKRITRIEAVIRVPNN